MKTNAEINKKTKSDKAVVVDAGETVTTARNAGAPEVVAATGVRLTPPRGYMFSI